MERLRRVIIRGYEEFVSERQIAQFCGKCSCLGCDGVCNSLPQDSVQGQANNVSAGDCHWATVEGVSGQIRDCVFRPTRWLEKILEPALANITSEIKVTVESVDEQRAEHFEGEIEQEIVRIMSETGEDRHYAYHAYFNNFQVRLLQRGYRMGGYHRDVSYDVGNWDVSHREWGIKHGYVSYESPQYLSQTGRQFYATIDACILAEGLSLERVVRVWGNGREGRVLEDLLDYTKPAFARLLALGYYRRELTN